MLYIDADNAVYGRLSSYVAKMLLEGEEVVIVNASKAVITGKSNYIIRQFLARRDIGSVRKGPYYPRTPSAILRRSIGDMLPKKKARGKDALKRCKVYPSIPMELRDKKFAKIDKAVNQRTSGYISLGDVSKHLGARVKE